MRKPLRATNRPEAWFGIVAVINLIETRFVNSREEQIAELRAAIAAQEAMRLTLGDATIELSLKPLRSLLKSLLSRPGDVGDGETSSRDELLAKLQSYIPKQLANKIRASGHVEGERRQVTVVFADISGFTALSERLDPEEVASFSNDCMKELVDAVYQYEGMVDKFIGDCIMAVFGAPIALEDDAERALLASLAMKERLEAFNQRWIGKLKEPLALHIGINSGTVIAGNVGNDLRMSYTVMGDTVNVASRLESAATRGQIFVSQSTHRLTHGAFTFRAMEPIRVKGKSDLLTVYELLSAKIQPDKIRGVEGLISPLVGREWECKVIRKAVAATKLGHSAIVLVYGDAGVGKSRLLTEVQGCESDGLTWLEGRCFASSQTLSYAPILDLIRRRSGMTNEQSIEEQQAALRRHVATDFPADPEVYSVLAQLLALPLSDADTELIKALTGEEFRTRFFSIIEQRVLALSEKQPVVLVIEDLHWADQSTIDLLAYILPLVKRTRLTFIGISRSRQEPISVWDKLGLVLKEYREHLVEVPLQSLSIDASRILVKELLGGDCLPESLVAEILDKSEGNPFFLEEVLRSLIESGGLISEGGKWAVASLTGKTRVPDTLQAVLLSRLDRLPEDLKQLVQKAAVIGRVFLYRILEKIAGPSPLLDGQLDTLETTDLVRERCRLPEIEYIFKHALTQEVAYQTLLAPARKALHQKVGDALEGIFRDRLEEFAGVLAYHYFTAESWENALQYSVQAANAAFRVYAFPEARGHCRRALECLHHVDENRANLEQRIDLTIQLVIVSLQSEAPEKNLARLVEVESVAQLLGDPVRLARVQFWIGRANYAGGKLPEAISYFQKVLAVAPGLGDPELIGLPAAVVGMALCVQGHFKKSLQFFDQAIPLLERAKNRHMSLAAYSYRGGAHVCLGRYAAGMSDINRALEIARSSRDKNAETLAYTCLALVHLIAGEYTEGVASARRALEIAEETGDVLFRYSGNSFLAWGTFRLGYPNESLPFWAAAHEFANLLGGRLLFAEWFAAVESEALLEAGDPAAGLRRAEEALTLSKASGSIIGEALAECAIGRTLAAIHSRLDEAEQHLARGAGILEEIGARYDLVRAVWAEANVRLACNDCPGAIATLEKAATIANQCQLEREESMARALLAQLRTR
jgi:class 3 adenylate cyclase/tetratricopeptide (TPR) repeat protein